MPKFVITERIPTYQVWTYEVEAENETAALEQVLNGDVEAGDIATDEPNYTLAEYEIEDENGDVSYVEKVEDDNDNTQDNDEDEYDGTSWDMQSR